MVNAKLFKNLCRNRIYIKQNTLIMTNATFRIGKGRNAFEEDSNCNAIYRLYVLKTNILKEKGTYNESTDQYIFSNEEKLYLRRYALAFLFFIKRYCMHKGINESYLTPNRVQFYFNSEEEYFSIVYGFKFPINRKKGLNFTPSDLRLNLSIMALINFLPYIYLNNYMTDRPIATFDKGHIDNGPVFEYNQKESLKYFTKSEIGDGDNILDIEDHLKLVQTDYIDTLKNFYSNPIKEYQFLKLSNFEASFNKLDLLNDEQSNESENEGGPKDA